MTEETFVVIKSAHVTTCEYKCYWTVVFCISMWDDTLSWLYLQEGITYTGSVGGTIYAWTGNVLSRVITDAHTGPVFAMYTSLEDGLLVSGGKETWYTMYIPIYI